MGRSLGFGPTPRHVSLRRAPCWDSLSLWLRDLGSLNRATQSNSPVHSAKGTPSLPRREALTACGRLVSGSVSLPSRGAFHLSLTVLVRYRWPGVFSLGGWSPRIPPGFLVSRGTWVAPPSLLSTSYRPVTVSGAAFQRTSLEEQVAHSVPGLPLRLGTPTTLPLQRRQAWHEQGLGCSAFARRYLRNLG